MRRLAWPIVLLPLWLLYVGTFSTDVLLVGIGATALATTFALAIHRQGLLEFAVEPGVLVRELKSVPRIPGDFLRICGVLVRRTTGRGESGGFRWIDYPYRDRDAVVARGNRAVVTTTSSLAPNAYVIHIDGERGRMLVHELSSGKRT
jgi:hypothetical protein